jgi:hypothetical protein
LIVVYAHTAYVSHRDGSSLRLTREREMMVKVFHVFADAPNLKKGGMRRKRGERYTDKKGATPRILPLQYQCRHYSCGLFYIYI